MTGLVLALLLSNSPWSSWWGSWSWGPRLLVPASSSSYLTLPVPAALLGLAGFLAATIRRLTPGNLIDCRIMPRIEWGLSPALHVIAT